MTVRKFYFKIFSLKIIVNWIIFLIFSFLSQRLSLFCQSDIFHLFQIIKTFIYQKCTRKINKRIILSFKEKLIRKNEELQNSH
jgi:hypothetical protein